MEIGAIKRLQVQQRRLKQGPRGQRSYQPEAILTVESAALSPAGLVGQAPAGEQIDVHHAAHPDTRHRQGSNGVSIGFTSHYRWLRDQFGAHLTDGIAGENLVIDTEATFMQADLPGTLQLQTRAGIIELVDVVVAEPCIEFTRFCLQRPADAATDDALLRALESLRRGVRGYYARFAGSQATLAPGDLLSG